MNHNMKKRGLALLLACCCVFTAAPVAVKADNVSISTNQTPTGTYSSYTKAEVLKSDTVVYDTLSTSNNVHFYKYTAEKGGYFTVNLAQTSGKGKWNFSVYDADNGNQELETKPLASNYTSRIYNLRPGKSVYIKVERVKSMDITILDYQLTQESVFPSGENNGECTVGTGRQRYTGGSDKSAERHLDQWKFLQSFGCGLV